VYERLGPDPGARQRAYRSLFAIHLGDGTLGAIRTATNNGWALGGGPFIAEIETILSRRAHRLPRGGDRRSAEYARTRGETL
jgi:putative transposase